MREMVTFIRSFSDHVYRGRTSVYRVGKLCAVFVYPVETLACMAGDDVHSFQAGLLPVFSYEYENLLLVGYD